MLRKGDLVKKLIWGGCLGVLVLFGIVLCPLMSVHAEEQETEPETQAASAQTDSQKQDIQLAKADTFKALPSSEQDENADELRLDLARVVLFAETGNFDRAFTLIEEMKKNYPGNPRVLAAEADLNSRIGNYDSAFVGLNKALLLDPTDEDILEQQRTAVYAQGANVLGGFTFRQTGEAYEQLSRASGQTPITPTLSAMINVENDHLHSRTPIIRTDGSLRNFRGDEQRGALMLNKVLENNDGVSASVYANTLTAGAGLLYSLWNHSGVTEIGGEYNRPDWDYVETVIEQGTKSDFHVERKQIFTNDLTAALGGGANFYALHDNDAAHSFAWDLGVTYSRPYSFFGNPENEVNFSASYTADAEYFTFVDERGPASARFKPLPATDHEIHAFNVTARKKISSKFSLEGYGGYSVNRLNSANGPLYGGSLEYSLSNRLGLVLRASHTDSGGENNNQKEDQIGLNVKWAL
jgi:tetratricopeptide (TPR) repeat protein